MKLNQKIANEIKDLNIYYKVKTISRYMESYHVDKKTKDTIFVLKDKSIIVIDNDKNVKVVH